MVESQTLFDLLVGLDEVGSNKLINSELRKLAKTIDVKIPVKITLNNIDQVLKDLKNRLQELDAPINFDTSTLKKYAREVANISETFKPNPGIKNLPDLSAYKSKLAELLPVAFKVDQVITDIDKNIIAVYGSGTNKAGEQVALKLNDAMEASIISYKDKSSQIRKEMANEARSYFEQLKKLYKDEGKLGFAQKGGPGAEQSKQQTDLAASVSFLEQAYDSMYESIRQNILTNASLSDKVKQEEIAKLEKMRQAQMQALDQSYEKGVSEKARKDAADALVQYKKLSVEVNKIKLAPQTDVSDSSVEALEKQKSVLKSLLQPYDDLKKKVQEFDEFNKRTFEASTKSGLSKQYDSLVRQLGNLEAKTRTAANGFREANLKGEADKMASYGAALDNTQKELRDLIPELARLEAALDFSEESSKVAGFTERFGMLTDKVKLTAIAATELEKRFGFSVELKGTKSAKEFIDDAARGVNITKELSAALGGLKIITAEHTKVQSNYKQVNDALIVTYVNQDDEVRKMRLSYDEWLKTLRATSNIAGPASLQFDTLSKKIGEAAKKIVTWGISTKIVYGAWNAFKAGIAVVQDLDKELTQIAVVQGLTRESVKSLGKEYANAAVEFSKTVKEVAVLNTELVRQGLSIEEAADRAATIMKLSSAGMISVEQSLAVITAGTNALGVAHEKIADVLLKAANITASDVEGLGEAFTKTASGAKAAGLSIEQTTALLSTMKDVTQEGDTQLGTSLKSILARFNKIDEETGETNKALNETQKAIESVGISFTDSEDQIRNVYDILADLSDVWGTLDKNTKAYIATQAAGTRQQNRFFAIMDNFNRVQGVHNDLLTSAGSLQEAYATYMQGTEAATIRLKASTERLWVNFINSDVLSSLAEVATGLVNIIDKIGVLNVAVPLLTIKFAGLGKMAKAAFDASMLQSMSNGVFITKAWSLGIGAATKALLPWVAGLTVGIAVINAISKGLAKNAEETRKLKEEQFNAVNTGLELQSKQGSNLATIEDLGTRFSELNEIVKKNGGVFALTADQQKEYYDVQKSLVDLIPNLNHQFDQSGNVILNYGQSVSSLKAEYLAAKDAALALAAVEAPNVILEQKKQFSKNGGKDVKDKKALIAETQASLQQAEFELKMFEREQDSKAIQKTKERIAKYQAELLKLKTDAEKILAAQGSQELTTLMSKIYDAYGTIPAELETFFRSKPVYLNIQAEEDPVKQQALLEKYKKYFESKEIKIGVGVNPASLSTIAEDIAKLKTQFSKGIISSEEYNEKIGMYGTLVRTGVANLAGIGEEGQEIITALINSFDLSFVEIQDKALGLEQRRKENLAAASDSYDVAADSLNKYTNALALMNAEGVNSLEFQRLLISEFPQYAQFMGNKVKLSEIFQNAINGEAKTQTAAYINMLLNTETFINEKGGAYQTFAARIMELYGVDLSNYNTLEAAKADITKTLLKNLSSAWSQYLHDVGNGLEINRQALSAAAEAEIAAAGNNWNAIAQIEKKYARVETTLVSTIQNIQDQYNASVAQMESVFTDFTSSITIPDFKDIATDLSNISHGLDEAGNSLSDAGNSLSDAADSAKEAADAIKEANDAMQAVQDATKEVFDFALKYIEWVEETKRTELEETYEKEKELIEKAFEDKKASLEKEKDEQLQLLDILQEKNQAEEDALKYAKEREKLQSKVLNLEYQYALASLDTSISGIARRKTLEESLSEEKESLLDLENNRAKTLEEQAFANKKKKLEESTAQEILLMELTNKKKLDNLELNHQATLTKLDAQYSAENNYLAAKQATQTGMIQSLRGDMVPLVAAFKELAIANGEFWTFFGQEDVARFGDKVNSVLSAVKKLGFETIQTWQAVASSIDSAQSKANAAAAADAARAKAAATTSSYIPTSAVTKTAAATSVFKPVATVASKPAPSIYTSLPHDPVAVSLKNLANTALFDRNTAKATVAGSGRPSYSEGGRITHTGPAIVHGSKQKPEYVFNYPQFKDLAKLISQNSFSAPQPRLAGGPNKLELSIGSMLTIEGNVDKEVLPDIKRASEETLKGLKTMLKGMGK